MRVIRTFSLVAAVTVLAVQFFVLVPAAHAAPQTVSNPALTYNGSDEPVLNDDPATTATFGGFGINNGVGTTSPTATSSDSNQNQTYTWRINPLAGQMCSQATLTSLHIQADVTADTEGNPDLSALFLYKVDGSGSHTVGDYTIASGTDYSTLTGGFTPPGGDGIYGVVRGTASQFGSSLVGSLDATWDMSSFSPTDTFGIMVQQDSQDGSVNLQTQISNIELTYDDSNCVYDGAVTKTLLNPSAVQPGGTATYEIVLTNNGTEPIGVNGLEDRGVYEIPSSTLTYQSVSSVDISDIACTDYGAIPDVVGNDPDQLLPYHNHLTSHMLLCASQSSAIIPPGESRSFQVTFAVSADATRITNLVSYVIEKDPGLAVFAGLLGSVTSEGPDLVDLVLANTVSVDNAAVADYAFPAKAMAPTKLASSGSRIEGYGAGAILVLSAAGAVAIRRRRGFSIR